MTDEVRAVEIAQSILQADQDKFDRRPQTVQRMAVDLAKAFLALSEKYRTLKAAAVEISTDIDSIGAGCIEAEFDIKDFSDHWYALHQATVEFEPGDSDG